MFSICDDISLKTYNSTYVDKNMDLPDYKCNVTGHNIVVKVEYDVSDNLVDYNLCTQTSSKYNAIDEVKIEYDDVAIDMDNDMKYKSAKTEESITVDAKAENIVSHNTITAEETTDYDRTTATDVFDSDKIKVEIIQENITPKDCNVQMMRFTLTTNVASSNFKTVNYEETIQNEASDRAIITVVKCEDVFMGTDYSSDDDLPLSETMVKADSSPTRDKQMIRVPDDSTLEQDEPRVEFSTVDRLTADNQLKCQICPYRCNSERRLSNHLKTHASGDRYTCDICGYITTRKYRYQEHISIHSGEKPFQCEVCHKTFTQKYHVASHMRTHSGEKPFSCKICHKAFSQKGSLIYHMRTHSAEKPFSCEVCHRTFGLKGNLTRHMKTHSGQKPFSCEVCHKPFREKDHLTRHVRTHSEGKTYSCDNCSKTI